MYKSVVLGLEINLVTELKWFVFVVTNKPTFRVLMLAMGSVKNLKRPNEPEIV